MTDTDPSRNSLDDPMDKPIDLTTETGKQLVAAFGGTLKKLTWLRGEDVLLGNVEFLGVMHFLTCVRVEYKELEGYVPTRDPHARYTDIRRDPTMLFERVLRMAADGGPLTVELPGFEGEWILCIDPFRD